MSYNLRYKVSFSNDLDEQIDIEFAYMGYTGPVSNLQADDSALQIRSTVGDEDRFQPICGREAVIRIRIHPGDPASIEDFVAPQDTYIQVTIYQDMNRTAPIFQGFVMVEDNNEPLLDPPFVIEVKATDGLGMLQGLYFLDTNNNFFSGTMTVLGWLIQALYKTGVLLNLRVYFNIYNSVMDTTKCALDQVSLDAIAFMTGHQTPVGDTNPADFNTGFDDFYAVMEKIVRNFRCKLFQEVGYWHLVSLWDYMNPAGYRYYEYAFGTPASGIVPYTLVGGLGGRRMAVPIGKAQILTLVKEDSLKYLKLATKSVELTYNYNQALNKIQNQDFSQGDPQPAQNESIASKIIDPTYNNGHSIFLITDAYSLALWTLFTSVATGSSLGNFNYTSATPLDPANAFIRIVHDILGQEMLRFMVIKVPSGNTYNWVSSTKLLLDQNDILQITFSWRTRTATNHTGTGAMLVVLLYGDDGSYWALQCIENGTVAGNPTKWIQTDNNFLNQYGTMPACGTTIVQSTLDWNQIEVNTQALTNVPFAMAPVSGHVVLAFFATGGLGTEAWIKDISVKILPFLTGSFSKLQGDYNYARSNAAILQTRLETVEISDSPKRYFQGALVQGSGDVLLQPSWFRLGQTEIWRFTQLMTYLLYTGIYRQVRKIEGTVKGFLYLDQDVPPYTNKMAAGMRCTYFFVDTKWPDKTFMLASFDMNYATGWWRGVFLEVRNDQSDSGLQVPDFWQFSYLFTGLI